jgi:Asp-tRNA(Asn)/Glu-tRNA(Gln) amidotransferase C subunit
MAKKQHTLESQILFTLVQTLYGSKVSSEELREIQNQVDTIMESVKILRSFPLQNNDEPALHFTPYRKEE